MRKKNQEKKFSKLKFGFFHMDGPNTYVDKNLDEIINMNDVKMLTA